MTKEQYLDEVVKGFKAKLAKLHFGMQMRINLPNL